MNPEKAEKLFALMRVHGVEYLKTDKLEVKLSISHQIKEIKKDTPKSTAKLVTNPKVVPPQSIPPVEMKIDHHVNEVQNLLRLNDNDLVDKLFPDYSQLPQQKVSE